MVRGLRVVFSPNPVSLAVDMDPLSLLCRLATSVAPPRFHTVARGPRGGAVCALRGVGATEQSTGGDERTCRGAIGGGSSRRTICLRPPTPRCFPSSP